MGVSNWKDLLGSTMRCAREWAPPAAGAALAPRAVPANPMRSLSADSATRFGYALNPQRIAAREIRNRG